MENPQWWEKPRQPTGCKIHYMREEYNDTKNTEATTSCLLLPTRGGGYTVEATTSLSLSLSFSVYLSHALYNFYKVILTTPQKTGALSHIYTYMTFRHIYISVLPIGRNRSGPVL